VPGMDTTKTTESVAKRFFRYSFEDIDYRYELLTQSERNLCTREEFEELVKWVRADEESP